MERLKIVLCDANKTETESYAAICRAICEQFNVSADIRTYSKSEDVLFDMGDVSFSALVNILIVDPENGFEAVPDTVRRGGYDGLILYLSHSASPEHFRQAWSVRAFHFLEKGSDPQALSVFNEIFGKALQEAKLQNRQYFAVAYAGEYRQVPVKEIYYFETLPKENHRVKVVYKGGSFVFSSSLKELEEQFSSRGFVRSHSSYLVSVDSIHRINATEVMLNDSSKIPMSRSNVPLVKAAMLA